MATRTDDALRDVVKEKYGEAARRAAEGKTSCGCGGAETSGCGDPITGNLYDAEQIGAWAAEAGLERVRYRSLPPDAQAKGPGLFAATMRRAPVTRTRGS